NIAVAAQSIRDAQLTAAAQDTDFNKAKAVLGGEPPSLFWLAMDMIIIGVELKAAAMAVKSLARLHEAAVAARAASKAAKGAETEGKLKELLDRLRAEGDAVKGAEGKLGQKLVDDVNKTEGFAQPGGGAKQGGAAGGAGAAADASNTVNGVAFAGEGEAAGIPRWEQQGDFLIATRTQNGLLMRLNHAETLYFDVLVRNPGREAGILRNAATGEHIVGYGTTWEFIGPQHMGKGGQWELVRHYHPYTSRTSRIASTGDFNGMIAPQNGVWNRPVSSVIDWFDASAGKWRQTTFGFEPGKAEAFWLRFQDEAGGWHNVRFRDMGSYENFINQYRGNPAAIPADGALPSASPGRWNAPTQPLAGQPAGTQLTPPGPAHAVPPAANTNAAGQVDNAAGTAGGMAQPAAALPPQRVAAHHGHRTIVVPGEYVLTQSDDKVIIFQRPGASGESESVRIMREGAAKKYPYPNGYVRWYNKHGQPLNAAGKPGSQADTHFGLGPDDPLVPGLVEK
ncbi:MAG TPA: hypothetical protein VMZ28_02905, partial [Kofleriaceae bacterium]|nr:hypothetical protein [Kofleriaceae bacterium]